MSKSIAEMTDYELIQACLTVDNSYFAEIVRRYKNLVFSVILRMINDREEANDLAQEVFVKVYRNLDKYSPDFKFSTWIIRITTNHVIDYRRKKKQDTVALDDAGFDMAAPETDGSAPEETYLKKERSKMLADVVRGLPDMYKIPIVLYHQQGLSYQEIADITDEPLSKVKNRIFRGRKMLKDMLIGWREGHGYGVEPESGACGTT